MASMFVIFNFQPTFLTQCVDTFMFRLQTKFNKRSCSTSRVNATKLKTKQNGHTAAILLLHISQQQKKNITQTKAASKFIAMHHFRIQTQAVTAGLQPHQFARPLCCYE